MPNDISRRPGATSATTTNGEEPTFSRMLQPYDHHAGNVSTGIADSAPGARLERVRRISAATVYLDGFHVFRAH
jgi:hypothetical protein